MSTKRWLGNAASVTDLWTVNLSGTVISQTYTITINGKSITYIAGGSDTVAIICAALVAAWRVSTIPEFAELTAAGIGSAGSFTGITATQNVSGRPSIITAATGGGATFGITNTTAATGPNDFTNAQNWSTGTAPANSDTLVFDNGSIACCYNINSSLTGVTVYVNPGYSGTIGLPYINSNGSVTYSEYRTTALTLAGGTAVINAPNCQQCNLAFGANTTTVRVLATGSRLTSTIPVVLITGGNGSSALDVTKGDVGVAYYLGQTATFPTVSTGYSTSPPTDANVVLGAGCTLTTVTKNGGVMTVSASATTITQDVYGGSITLTDAMAVTTVNIYAGTCYLNTTGTIATINLYGSATLNADGDPCGKTITNNINCYAPSVTVIDTAKSINAGTLSINSQGTTSVNVQHGGNVTQVYT